MVVKCTKKRLDFSRRFAHIYLIFNYSYFNDADSKLIEQVLINLINNSIHALQGRNNPTIKISCTVENDKTILILSDNGKGIEEEILNQVFIPFFTTKKNGSGIGLSLSKNILKKHGGNLLVNSEPGAYTTFSLVFKNE